MLKFKPYVRVLLNEEESKVIMSRPLKDGDVGDIFELTPIGVKIIKSLHIAISKEELISRLEIKSQEQIDELNEILELLLCENYIGIESDNNNEEYQAIESVYGRITPLWGEVETQSLNRFQIQQSMMTKKIGIIGCGTIGMGIISKLVTVGVKKFVLVDDDLVSRTNLTRQSSFLLKDIGKPKVEVANQFIIDRIENPTVDFHFKKIKNLEDLKVFNDVDIIVVASDEPRIDKLVQEYGKISGITLSFSGGYTGSTGKIFPIVIHGKTHDYNCVHDYLHNVKGKETKGYKDLNINFTMSSITSVADFIVSVSSFEILKYLTGVIDPYLINKVLFFNFANYKVDELIMEDVECSCMNSLETTIFN